MRWGIIVVLNLGFLKLFVLKLQGYELSIECFNQVSQQDILFNRFLYDPLQ